MFKYNKQSIGLNHLSNIIKDNKKFQSTFKMIQVAGTNGKGSTCHYLYSYLKKTDQNVALFTSPHLYKINERIEFNGHQVSDIKLQELSDEVDNTYPQIKFGFFEKLCLIFILFCNQNEVDIAIVEVGLGGRLDPTNLISNNKLCLLTSLSLDHQEILGDTIEKITFEKLGICNQQNKLFLSHQLKSMSVIQRYCRQKSIEIIQAQQMSYFTNEIQNNNAGLAKSVLKHMGYKDKIDETLSLSKKVGRLQHFNKNNLMDVCHNEESLQALVNYIQDSKLNFNCIYFNFLKSKDHKKLLKTLRNLSIKLTLVELEDSRTLNKDLLQELSISQSDFLKSLPSLENALVIGCFPLVGLVIHTLDL
ncbi:MAG: hypothetical protein KC646_07435 [Candidatus Cloacimonetes bacterium]|nr:hypothetical protein [Candidatus Cloacimonadota bacterium]